MTIEQLRAAHRAVPFQPFTIRMADGRSFHVRHPELLMMSPTGRTAGVYLPDGVAHIIDLLLMTELEIAPSPATPA